MRLGEATVAACDLAIELDEPDKVYCDGEKITGQVVVQVQKEVNCKSLTLGTAWVTHGRGNVDSGQVDSAEIFSGPWQAGQEYRYAFELATAGWPPTYYGTYLNVSHQVQARAKLAWAFDPKAEAEFPVSATKAPDDLMPTAKKSGCSLGIVGWILGGIFIAIFGVLFLFLVPVLLVVGGLIWFFTSYLPKSLTGKVDVQVEPKRLKPGEKVAGSISFAPKRRVRINEVCYTVQCEEKCVSGSGSNRTTHRHEVMSTKVTLLEAGDLLPRQNQSLDFEFSVPKDAGPSMKFSDNELNWSVELRIDIPRWPDWSERVALVVEPSGKMDSHVASTTGEADGQAGVPDWMDQVVQQLLESRDDAQRLELVLAAIREHVFDVSFEVEGRLDSPPEGVGIRGGVWLKAFDEAREIAVLLRCDGPENAPPENSHWNGRIAIVGFLPGTAEIVARRID